MSVSLHQILQRVIQLEKEEIIMASKIKEMTLKLEGVSNCKNNDVDKKESVDGDTSISTGSKSMKKRISISRGKQANI